MARVPGSVVCSLAVAAATIAAVLADVKLMGPYKIDVDTYGGCDGGGGGIIFDVRLVSEGDEAPVYEGNITYTYDYDNPSLVLRITVYKWGSEGGWIPYYTLQARDAISFARRRFPKVQDDFFRALNISNETLRAGTYHLTNYRPVDGDLKFFKDMPYGRFKMVSKQFSEQEELGCWQITANIKELNATAV